MRRIKFKAKRLDNKTWAEGYFYAECGNTYIIEDRQSESMLNRNEAHQVDPLTVCQFTGLKDCEGNEIWEGDILLDTIYGSLYTVMRSGYGAFFIRKNKSVNYDMYMFKLIEEDKCIAFFEVVGNKFDKKK